MISRHGKIQDKKATRTGVLLIFLSILILGFMFFWGLPAVAKFSGIVFDIKGTDSIVEKDITAPAPPQFTPSPPEFVTEPNVKLTIRSEAGSTLKIIHNGEEIKEALVGETSIFVYNLKLVQGDNTVSATSTDSSGNESAKSAVWEITYDKNPPLIEITSPEDGSQVNSKNLLIEGQIDKDAKVTINDRQAIVNPDGKFSLNIALSEGENIINIKAIDNKGIETERQIRVNYIP